MPFKACLSSLPEVSAGPAAPEQELTWEVCIMLKRKGNQPREPISATLQTGKAITQTVRLESGRGKPLHCLIILLLSGP